jgi:hypothetical protein
MPITLGNTTISGLTSGGLPNGTVTINNIKSGAGGIIALRELTSPIVIEFSHAGSFSSDITISGLPANTRYILSDVFTTANTSDHQNWVMGENRSSYKNWVDVRGSRPGGEFGVNTEHTNTMTYQGESDGFTPNYGIWFPSQIIKMKNSTTLAINNYGNSGSSGWVYMIIKGYSL